MNRGIVVNARFQTRCVTGVERYAGEILRRMQAQIRQVKPGYRLNGLGGHVWEQFILPLGIKKDEILWSPANTGPILVSNQIITIHDTSFLDHPEWYQPEFVAWYQFVVPRLLHRARVVTTVSSYSKIRILQAYRIYDGKVQVIPGGVDLGQFKPQSEGELRRVRNKYSLAETYVLSLGSMQPRKNLPRLFDAWRQVHPRFPDVELVIAGGGGAVFRKLETQEAHPGVRILGYVDDTDLPALYAGARAYCLISLNEGFGLTILEAMACGTPVVASNLAALPEVVGDAGRLVDPLNAGELIDAFMEMIADGEDRRLMIQKGLERAQQFTWEQSADQMQNLLVRELEKL